MTQANHHREVGVGAARVRPLVGGVKVVGVEDRLAGAVGGCRVDENPVLARTLIEPSVLGMAGGLKPPGRLRL